jgi:hypothetical protein
MKAVTKPCPKCGATMVKVEPRRWNLFKKPTWVCAFRRVETKTRVKLGAICRKIVLDEK